MQGFVYPCLASDSYKPLVALLQRHEEMKHEVPRIRLLWAGLAAVPLWASAGPSITPVGPLVFQVAFDPLVFRVKDGGEEVAAVVFEDFYAATQQASCGNAFSGTAQVSVNGGPVANLTGMACTGVYNQLNAVDGNDLLVTIYASYRDTFGLSSIGDRIRVSSSDYRFSLRNLNPAMNQGPFNASLVNNNFARISNLVSTASPIPEPGTVILLALGLAAIGGARYRTGRASPEQDGDPDSA